ncbi:MAG TPA: glycerol kinase GlpK [Thermoanaerobaculia bacterium]|nr:glycerol kinase GlpK [Thermoanaerobaculia bacterium]
MPILALDQGTTSARAIVFDESGQVVASAQRELQQIYPQPGWVEHDPREIASSQLEVAKEVSRNRDIAAIGITNQRETTILWDRKTGQPIANAIVWQDRRTAAMCDALREYEPLFRERTGLVLDPYFSGTKIRWLLDHVGGKNLAFGTVDSWLIWSLTGGRVHVTDATNASRTLLFNIHTRDWDDELLRILRIPREILPRVVSSSEVVGETAEGVPIAGIAGDQQAALFGQRCVSPGMAKNTYGTGCFIVMNTGDRAVKSQHGLLTTLAATAPHPVPLPRDHPLPADAGRGVTGMRGDYALEGSVFIAGAVVQWLRDELRIIRTAADVEALAASVPDNGGLTFIPAFTGLGAPHWDPHARGAILGMTRGTKAAHIARAALEAIALQTAEVLDAMRADSGLELTELRVDGAASRNNLLMQIQADVAGVRVVRAAISETTALGAAYLAGLEPRWKADRVFEPKVDRSALRDQWREAIARVTSSPT